MWIADAAKAKGWKTCAMVVTVGAYGDAWRSAWNKAWTAKGGQIVGDFPANYFAETDFSSQLTSAMSRKPDFMLIGGPSATTALVIEQARNMGFKGGFVMIDQAKPEYVAKVLKNMKLLEGLISTASCQDLPLPVIQKDEQIQRTAKYPLGAGKIIYHPHVKLFVALSTMNRYIALH
ncbi:MAG: ABC transporter substrate-binding protein [Smithellaceae bacterium]